MNVRNWIYLTGVPRSGTTFVGHLTPEDWRTVFEITRVRMLTFYSFTDRGEQGPYGLMDFSVPLTGAGRWFHRIVNPEPMCP